MLAFFKICILHSFLTNCQEDFNIYQTRFLNTWLNCIIKTLETFRRTIKMHSLIFSSLQCFYFNTFLLIRFSLNICKIKSLNGIPQEHKKGSDSLCLIRFSQKIEKTNQRSCCLVWLFTQTGNPNWRDVNCFVNKNIQHGTINTVLALLWHY